MFKRNTPSNHDTEISTYANISGVGECERIQIV